MISFIGLILFIVVFISFLIWEIWRFGNMCPICYSQMKYNKIKDMLICPYCSYAKQN